MNKQELEQKIASMEKELAELKQELTTQDKIWQPKNGEEFWVITGAGVVLSSRYYVITSKHYYVERCNYFKTKEEAEKQAKYNKVMNRFRKYVEAYSEPLDWNNDKQAKYYINYELPCDDIDYLWDLTTKDAFQIYASSEQILKDAIKYSAGSEEEFIRIVFNGGEIKC